MKRLLLLLLVLVSSVAYATVTNQSVSVTFSCSGSAGPYPFAFPISNSSALTVTQDGIVLSTSAYSIAPVNNNYVNGGSVTLNSVCNSPSTLVLTRVTPLTQTTVYADNMPIPMKTFERSLDKLTEITQELYGTYAATPGSASLSGNNVFTGSNSFKNINSILFADQFCTTPGTHDQTCINNAITAAVNGQTVFVPYEADWLLTGTINITKAVNLQCAGWSTTLRVSSGLSGSTDVVYVNSSAAIEGGSISECQFLPQSGTPGRYGLHVDTTSHTVSKFNISHNYFGTFGTGGFHLTNPSASDGLFNLQIRGNVFYNGMTFQRVGDNVLVEDNTIPGANIGIDATQVHGSMGLVARHNSITSAGACFHLGDGFTHPILEENLCEGSVSVTGSNSAYVDLDGSVGWPIIHPEVINNTKIAGVASTINGLRLNYVKKAVVDGNTFYRAGSAVDIITTANTEAGTSYIGWQNNYDAADLQSAVLTDVASTAVCWNNPWSQISQGGVGGGIQCQRPFAVDALYTNTGGADLNNHGIAHTGPLANVSAISGTAVSASANHAVCWKTTTTLGYCSDVVSVTGTCTCN